MSLVHALIAADADKQVTGKQGQIHCGRQSPAPLALRAVEGQIMFNFPRIHVLSDALLMAGRGVNGEPLGHEPLLRRAASNPLEILPHEERRFCAQPVTTLCPYRQSEHFLPEDRLDTTEL